MGVPWEASGVQPPGKLPLFANGPPRAALISAGMAARRLLIVMVVLLAASTLAAALVPVPEEAEDEATTSAPTTAGGDAPPSGGEVVEAEVAARSAAAREIRLSPGDQLSLVVTRSHPGEVRVPAFGLAQFAEPGAPARFDVLVRRPGRFAVRADGAGTVATIVATRDDAQAVPRGQTQRDTAGTRPRMSDSP